MWVAGHHLAKRTGALARQTGTEEVFMGMVLLGLATSLPEVSTMATAGLLGDARLAVGNVLGGIAFQVALLVGADFAFGRRPLASALSRPTALLQGVLLVGLLALVLVGILSGEREWLPGVGLWSAAAFLAYVGAVALVRVARPSWRPADPGEEDDEPRPPLPKGTIRRHALVFGVAALVTLVAGATATHAAEAIARRTGLGSSFGGVALLAVSTSLPEVSSTVAAARLRAPGLAFGGIFGTNLASGGLLLLADAFYRPGPVLAQAGAFEATAAGLGILLTSVYLVAILRRGTRAWLRLGPESVVAALAYLGGLWLLYGLR